MHLSSIFEIFLFEINSEDIVSYWQVHSVHWGITPFHPPSETSSPLFCEAPTPLNLQTVQTLPLF